MVLMTDPYEELSRHFIHHHLTHDFFSCSSIFQLKKHHVSLGICHNSEFWGCKKCQTSTSSDSSIKLCINYSAIVQLKGILRSTLLKCFSANSTTEGTLGHFNPVLTTEPVILNCTLVKHLKRNFSLLKVNYGSRNDTSFFLSLLRFQSKRSVISDLATPSGQYMKCNSLITPFKRTYEGGGGGFFFLIIAEFFFKEGCFFLTITFLYSALQVH